MLISTQLRNSLRPPSEIAYDHSCSYCNLRGSKAHVLGAIQLCAIVELIPKNEEQKKRGEAVSEQQAHHITLSLPHYTDRLITSHIYSQRTTPVGTA